MPQGIGGSNPPPSARFFSHKQHQNTFAAFENALGFLDKEFNTLDTETSESEEATLWKAIDFYFVNSHPSFKR
jgi:hypothetical protein